MGHAAGDERSLYSLGAGSNRLAGISSSGAPSRSLAAGNIATDTDATTSKAFTWNSAGQLGEVKIGGVSKGTYAYDYLSRLVARQLPASSTTLHYVHDLDGNVIAEYDGSGALLREYVWLEDRPVAAITAGTTPVTYWVHTDHLERPAMMTDETDAVVWRAKYLPYGEVYSITGPASLDYRFPGQWFQLESGLNYNWHRHYDPTTGRYLQPDPLGMPDGPSRWAYAKNSPLTNVDPRGLAADRPMTPISPKPLIQQCDALEDCGGFMVECYLRATSEGTKRLCSEAFKQCMANPDFWVIFPGGLAIGPRR